MKRLLPKKNLICFCFLCFMAAFFLFPGSASAARKNGWVTKGSTRYYYQNGQKVTGMKKIGSYTYYFRKETGTMVKSRWVRKNGNYYYFLKNGRMAKKRWIGSDYYVKSNGVRVTSLTTIHQANYYFSKKGVLKTNTWVKKNGLYYRVDENGKVDFTEGFNKKDPTTATKIRYQSSTITIELQKHTKYQANYWTALVKIKNAHQLRSALSYGTYGGTRETTSSAVKRNNGIIGMNGSAFSYSSGKPGFDAVMIKNGKIKNKALGTSYSLMAVTWDGMMYTPKQGLSAKQLVQQNVRDTYNFGPAIIMDGFTQPIIDPFQDTVSRKDPRSAVGMIRPGEYVLLVADGRGKGGSMGLNYYDMASIFQSFGCTYAYNLDGGGSATLVYKGRVMNNPSDGTERSCGDFLYFIE